MTTLIEGRSEFKDGEVVVFKIVTGEELIGRVVQADPLDKVVVFTGVFRFEVSQTGPDSFQLQLAPYYISQPPEKRVEFFTDHIISKTYATQQVTLDAYNKHTTGIETNISTLLG